MPITRDLGDLPRRPPKEDVKPVIGRQVAPEWLEQALAAWMTDVDEGPRGKALPERRWRASWSGDRCNRSLWYRLNDYPEDTPPSLADEWRWHLGKLVGADIVKYLEAVFKGKVEAEVPTDLENLGIDGSSFVEILVTDRETGMPTRVVEIKTINGIGFKEVSIGWRGQAAPRFGHVVQTCVEAAAYHVPAVLIYLATELIGAGMAESKGLLDWQRFATVWTFTAEEVDAVAQLEAERIADVAAQDRRPPRVLVDPTKVPAGSVVTNPKKGEWMTIEGDGSVSDMGTVWFCDYCPFRETCIKDGP